MALVFGFAVLHLTVARADAACAMQDHDAPAPSHAGMQHDAPAPADEAPCEAPLSSDCCHAVLSCAPVLTVSEGHFMADPAIVHASILPAVFEQPSSRSKAPEPPPPKA